MMMRRTVMVLGAVLFGAYVAYAANGSSMECPLIGQCASIHVRLMQPGPRMLDSSLVRLARTRSQEFSAVLAHRARAVASIGAPPAPEPLLVARALR